MSENLNKKPPKGILKQSSSFDTNNSKLANSFGTPRSSITSLGPGAGLDFALGANILPEEDDPTSPTNRKSSKCAKFDEMNILETLHPADKDYGHMKIEEPKTPFNYYEDGEEDLQSAEDSASQKQRHSSHQHKKPHEILLDPEELAQKIKEKGVDLPSFMNNIEDGDEKSEEEEDMDPESKAKQVVFESKRKAHYNEYFAVKLARQLMEKETDDDDEEEENKFIPSEEINPEESDETPAAAVDESSEMKDV